MRNVKRYQICKGAKDFLCCAVLLLFLLAAAFADEETLLPTVLFFLAGVFLCFFAFVAKTLSLYFEKKMRDERI